MDQTTQTTQSPTTAAQFNTSPTDLYDSQKRGASAPEYSAAELTYRNNILNGLQLAYNIREQPQMELNDKPYSMYYLTNRQQDMAYNPPKMNPTDSRIVTGVIHEKDNTIEQVIVDMNLQPKFEAIDKDNPLLVDLARMATALVKNELKRENFDAKVGQFARINVSQGNVFLLHEVRRETEVKKIMTNQTADPTLKKWTTVIDYGNEYCETVAIPNTAVYFSNLLESDLHKQDRIWIVMHVPRSQAEKMFSQFPRWQNVPLYPTSTVPPNTNGIWGDFYMQQPQKDFVEIILTQSEVQNDYNIMVNSVLMYPVYADSNGKITGYPLTEFSPSGKYTLVKGTNEKIPFYAYGRSVPSKNEVKEEVANEFLRIAVHKFRYSAFPSVGNNSDKVLPASIWNPSEVIPDLDASKISVLNPNGRLDTADFSFYQMIMQSINDTSVSTSLEGTNDKDVTATQYVDQKKENLKKLGITIDGTVDFLKETYWLYLWSIVEYLDKKRKTYDPVQNQFIQAYNSFVSEESVDGIPGQVRYQFQDDTSNIDLDKQFQKEFFSPKNERTIFGNPTVLKDQFKRLMDQLECKVVSEPDGQNQSLLGVLFNLLTQYQGLRGGQIPNLNYEYIDKIIDQNSGFDQDKLFLDTPPQSMAGMQPLAGEVPMGGGNPTPGAVTLPGTPPVPGATSLPRQPQNGILANSA